MKKLIYSFGLLVVVIIGLNAQNQTIRRGGGSGGTNITSHDINATNADSVRVYFDDSANTNSGMQGLHVDKPSSLNNPNGISYDIDGVPKWETEIDVDNDDMVLLYHGVNISPWGTADLIRVSTNRNFVFGPLVGSPTDYPGQFNFLRGTNKSGLFIRHYISQADVADAILIEREGDAGTQWITWTQGDLSNDWRIGLYKNSTYDFAFFKASSTNSSASSPGTQLATISSTGSLAVAGGVTATNGPVVTPAYDSTHSTLTHAGTVNLNFAAINRICSMTLTGNCTFTYSNLSDGPTWRLLLKNAQSSNCTLAFPAGTKGYFTSTLSNGWHMVSIESWGTVASNVWVSTSSDGTY